MNNELKSLNALLGQIEGTYHDMAVDMGLADSVLKILYAIISEGDGCNQSSLYKTMGLGKSTVNSAIRKMEKDGLLYLKSGEGRNTKVFLTEKGQLLSENTAGRIVKIEEEILSSWTEKERNQYLNFMQKFLNQLTEKSKGALL